MGNKVYEVRDVEERLDVYELVGYRIAKIVKPVASENGQKIDKSTSNTSRTERNKIREFLGSHVNDSNIVRDNGSAGAVCCVIYSNLNYPIIKEFLTSTNPVDGLYTIGIPETMPLIDADQSIYAYNEHVPIFVKTIDKDRVAGSRLQEMMETELRRICETYRIDDKQKGRLEKRGDRKEKIGSTVVYSTEFIFHFTRSARGRKGSG